jgi:hypothetical protein
MSHVEVQQNGKPDPIIKTTCRRQLLDGLPGYAKPRVRNVKRAYPDNDVCEEMGALKVRVIRCATALNRLPEMKHRVVRNICN